MAFSLSDVRTNSESKRPERSVSVCLRPDLVAEIQELTEVIQSASFAARQGNGEAAGPPRRMADGGDSPEIAAAREKLAHVRSEMLEHSGDVRLRARWTDGEWRR